MLESSLFESQRRKKFRNPATAAVSMAAHVVTIAVLVLIPLLQTQALTIPPVDMSLLMPRAEQSRSVAVFSKHRQAPRRTQVEPDVFTAPSAIPDVILNEVPAPIDPGLPPPMGSNVGIPGPLFSNAAGPALEIARPEPPQPPAPVPPAPPVTKIQPIRVSSGPQEAKLILQVKPAYPDLARRTRTQGVVVLEAKINRDGDIDSLRVVSGHQLLTQAALDAVKQWKYRPTMLNGEPVEVITTITVTFTLQ